MQTSYNVNPAPGVVGAIAESGPKVVESKIASGTVRPGQYVIFAGDECSHPTSEPTPAQRGGIALRHPYKQADGVYADGELVDVLTVGKAWAASEVAASADTPVFVRVTAAGNEQLGALRNNSDGGDAFQIPGLYFRTAGTDLVKLEIHKSAYDAP